MITKVGDRIRICWRASALGGYPACMSILSYRVDAVRKDQVRVSIGFEPHWIRSWVRVSP